MQQQTTRIFLVLAIFGLSQSYASDEKPPVQVRVYSEKHTATLRHRMFFVADYYPYENARTQMLDLLRNGANPNGIKVIRQSLLGAIVLADDIPALEAVLGAGADPNALSSGDLPITLANSISAAKLLLDHKANPEAIDIYARRLRDYAITGPTDLLSFYCRLGLIPGGKNSPINALFNGGSNPFLKELQPELFERNLAVLLDMGGDYHSCYLTLLKPPFLQRAQAVIAADKIVKAKRLLPIKQFLLPHLPKDQAELTTSFVGLEPLEHTKLFELFEQHAGLQLMPPGQEAQARALARCLGCCSIS